jgi:hypothetical protein
MLSLENDDCIGYLLLLFCLLFLLPELCIEVTLWGAEFVQFQTGGANQPKSVAMFVYHTAARSV